MHDKISAWRDKRNKKKENIKFIVGIIVRHSGHFMYSSHLENSCNIIRKIEINHDGVIIGWQNKCYINSPYDDRKELNYFLNSSDVHFCACNEPSQPHYKILIEDDRECYVLQRMIINNNSYKLYVFYYLSFI